MYESFFALRCRPFSATPNPECYVPVPATDAALAEICSTVKGGQGIAVLTAPAGLGKTLVCLRLANCLGEDCQCVWLPTANYCTRRSLLQAILYELGRPYAQMAEQELRLQLISTARTHASRNRAVVVIADEAHLLSPRLLEELRALTNVAAAGRTLIRVVLSGQLQLEETLAEPELSALNQRVDCQVTLVPLTSRESRDYLATRLRWAGGEPETAFAPEALDLICRASDGDPRCLNQLADHALALGCSRDERPVTAPTVRTALDELKQLPLHWTDSDVAESQPAGAATDNGSYLRTSASTSFGRGTAPAAQTSVFESGLPGDSSSRSSGPAEELSRNVAVMEVGAETMTPAAAAIVPPASPRRRDPQSSRVTAGPRQVNGFIEEPVIDRYAMLDAGLVPAAAVTVSHERHPYEPAASQDDPLFDPGPDERRSDDVAELLLNHVDVVEFEPCEPRVAQLLDGVVPMLEAIVDSTSGFDVPPQLVRSAEGPRHEVLSTDAQLEQQIGTLLRETTDEVGRSARGAAVARAIADRRPASAPAEFDWADQANGGVEPPPAVGGFDVVLPEDDAAGFADDTATLPRSARGRIEREDAPKAACPPRHYAQLFSELRRRHRERT